MSRFASLCADSTEGTSLLLRESVESARRPRFAGLANVCARVSGISLKIIILPGFRSHTVHIVN